MNDQTSTISPTTTPVLQWAPSPEVESWIGWFDVDDWRMADVHLSQINVTRSQALQNRDSERLDQANVDSIAYAVGNGRQLPPAVLREDGGEFLVINGNHRLAALKKVGVTEWTAYVVRCTDETAYLMAASANAGNGKPNTREFMLREAASIVTTRGISMARAAAMFYLSESALSSYMLATRGRQALQQAGLKADNLPVRKLEVVQRLDPDQLRLLGAPVVHPSVSAKELKATAQAILGKPAVEQAGEVQRQAGRLQQVVADRAKPSSGVRRKTPYVLASRALTGLLDVDLVDALHTAPPEKQSEAVDGLLRLRDRIDSALEVVTGEATA